MIVRTEGQYSLVQLEQARLFSSLLYGTQTKLVSIQFAGLKEKNTRFKTVSVCWSGKSNVTYSVHVLVDSA